MVDGKAALEIIEELYFDVEDEQIINLVTEILDEHFEYDEEFFF